MPIFWVEEALSHINSQINEMRINEKYFGRGSFNYEKTKKSGFYHHEFI